MKKTISVLLILVMILSLFAGCSSKSVAGNAADVDNGAAKGDALYGEGYETPAEGESAAVSDQKLIKTVSMDAETDDLDTLLASLDAKIKALGGYMENRKVYNGSKNSTRSRYANMTIRVPAASLDEFVEQVEGMSNIVSSNQAIDNVTLKYVATESRLKALQAEEERLLELMAKAETMADLLKVEARLTEVRSDLESVASALRVLENQVSYATVTLSVSEVREYTVVEEKSAWQRMGEGFVESLKDLGDSIVEFAVFVVAKLPYLVVWGLIAVVVIIIVKRKPKKHRRKPHQPPFPTVEEEKKPE